MISRRTALKLLAGGSATAVMANGLRLAVADAPTERRFVLVILRGGLDGLASVPAYADPDYHAQRGSLAFDDPDAAEGALDLDGFFGLHPSLSALHGMFRAGELLVVHAVATPYRSRSHFDGQNLLENGTARVNGATDGWLNRALGLMSSERQLGLAIGQSVPLVLRGPTPVGSWSPVQALPAAGDDFLSRLATLYRDDLLFGPALTEAIRLQEMSDEIIGKQDTRRSRQDAKALTGVAESLARFLADPNGPRVAVLEAGGWDTHANQGLLTGRLAGRLAGLGEGLAVFKEASGSIWRDTVVAVVTEFGRTVAVNGTGGTDHGTAGAVFLLGGAVAGGRVIANWPGLSGDRLYGGRDLAPTTDLHAVWKSVLAWHLELPRDGIERIVFPGSAGVSALPDLIKT